jgi:uncharacterized protein (DUF433 family)
MTRTGTARRYTPQEAAALAGVRLRHIQNAIATRQLGREFAVAADGRQRIDLPAVLTFAAVDRLGNIRIAPATLYQAFRKAGLPHGPVPVTDAVTIDASRLLGTVLHKVRLYETVHKRIISDLAIMGGVPVVKGTRIPARTLYARVTGGDSIESILEDYPYLDRETIETAVLFVEANPACRRAPRSPEMDDA